MDEELKIGDRLYCHKSVVMDYDGFVEFTEGDLYTINNINSAYIFLTNNSKGPHQFSLDPEEESYWGKWFTKQDKKIRDDIYDLLSDLD